MALTEAEKQRLVIAVADETVGRSIAAAIDNGDGTGAVDTAAAQAAADAAQVDATQALADAAAAQATADAAIPATDVRKMSASAGIEGGDVIKVSLALLTADGSPVAAQANVIVEVMGENAAVTLADGGFGTIGSNQAGGGANKLTVAAFQTANDGTLEVNVGDAAADSVIFKATALNCLPVVLLLTFT